MLSRPNTASRRSGFTGSVRRWAEGKDWWDAPTESATDPSKDQQ